MSKNKLGLLFGISAYSLWGAFPLYWPLLEPANPLEIVSHRAVWTLVFCFIVLAATLPTVGHIPVAAIALIFGIDRFMSEGRALTNIIGNTVATIVVAKWEKEIDMDTAKKLIG